MKTCKIKIEVKGKSNEQEFNVMYDELLDIDNPIDIISIKPIKGELMPEDWNENLNDYKDGIKNAILEKYYII